jgi:hypothetical protein
LSVIVMSSLPRRTAARFGRVVWALGLLGLLLSACQKHDKTAQPAQQSAKLAVADAGTSTGTASPAGDRFAAAAAAAKSAADAGPPIRFVGVVRGVVKLAKGQKLPLAPPPLSHGIKPPSVAPCPPIDLTDQRTIALAKQTGGLSPVHLALTGMRAVPPREPATHELFIDACRLRPTLVGAMRGDKLRVTNRSDSAMIPTLPGDKFMRGMMRGETREAPIAVTQLKVSCGFGSYCGEALVIATTHPLYAVTSSEGFYTIENVPLDQDLNIHAWAPLFDVSSEPFRLSEDKREAVINLVLTPLPAKPVPAATPAAQPTGPRKGKQPAAPEERTPNLGPAFQ